ncbi:hypothetical protein ON010_g12757 [Phytophthora cinnamomi]|nr:hypothetical protein ON010_g12757 [Phytophthora cinnamomi]
MAMSPCGDWLLVGHGKGGLRVWNVNGSRTNGSALFTIDADPYEPTGAGVAEAQAQVISSIEVTTTPTPGLNGTNGAPAPTDVIVIAAERDTGVVRHWMFSVERKVFGNNNNGTNSGEHRYPRLNLVGKFDAGGKEQIGKDESPSKFKNQDTLGPPLKTLVMCVTIDMGSCFEKLLLVVREDVIHVLKVQTVLYVMQEYASIEEAYSVRAITQQGESKVISLSSTAACKLLVFPLDEPENPISSSTKQLFITPHAVDASPHVCSIETVTNEIMQIYFVVIAWSSGVVDVYDLIHEKHVMKLQDNRLTDQISALSVVTFQKVVATKSAPTESDPTGYLSSRSYEDVYLNGTNKLVDVDPSDETEEEPIRKTVIVVGTETGKLYGWKAEALYNGDLSFKSIPKANVRAQAAHLSHIVQIARMDAVALGERAVLASVAADGIIKLWQVPSLKMIGYVSSTAEGYTSPASCIEVMRGQSTIIAAGNRGDAKVYVIAGYEDGGMGIWCVDMKRVSFQRLQVSTKHERRVSKICRVTSDVVSAGSAEFLSCSLDMTVIQWEVLESGSVQEKRYFDIGTAIVDMVLVEEQAILALAHEVCKFSFAPSSKCDMKYLMKPEVAVGCGSDADNYSTKQDTAPVRADEYPSTPTTRSIEDYNDVGTQPRHTSRSVDEYLTLHVPSAVLHLEAASLSAVTTTTASDSAPATGLSEQDDSAFNPRNEMTSRHRGHKSADKLQRHLISDDVLRQYLQDYIARHGSGGTMAANRITHLLALRPELPSVKRPGFALAKSLKDLKLTAQTRVDSEEALQVMRLLLTMSTASCPSFDAPTMARSLKLNDHSSEKARTQRIREKKQTKRKPVVTYNLLGEKYVRWEDAPEEESITSQNQSPPSPANSLIVHTPPSPNLRDDVGFENDPLYGDVENEVSPPLETPSSTAENVVELSDPNIEDDASAFQGNSPESNEIPATDITEPILTSPRLIVSSQINTSVESTDEEEEEEEEDGDIGGNDNETGDGGSGENNIPLDCQNHVALERSTSTKAIPAITSSNKIRRITHGQRHSHSVENIFESPLVNGIRLSPMFQKFWTKGYCWCLPAPRLRIHWTDNAKAKSESEKSDGAKRRSKKCKVCHKRLHTIELPRVGSALHFSRQAVFDVIVKVYNKLTTTAHTRLYKTSSPRKERTSEFSIFGALFEVFLATYGMRSAVELKLKLFFVSMCHYLREYDAVAVFGELLGLHTPEHADEYDQAPNTLVALCVCCYSWLYSRGMIVNGESFSGRLRGGEWGIIYGAITAEVAPATDGTTHWQFVRIEHALLCAQDNLLYPLVSPGFLRNIMLFMQEYAQYAPTRLLRTESPDFSGGNSHYYRGPALWIELHRFLRLLVGEWKQQNAQFRVVERLLFVHPQRDAALEGDLLEKLRLMLSCFVFYDHERVGAMAISDFEVLLFKLRYLWSEEGTVEQVPPIKEKLFENATLAIRKRFIDLNHDGQLCYLDFWAMLYIRLPVGSTTRAERHGVELHAAVVHATATEGTSSRQKFNRPKGGTAASPPCGRPARRNVSYRQDAQGIAIDSRAFVKRRD